MYINDFKQEHIVNSINELDIVLQKRYSQNSNHLILTFEESGFPQISAFVKDNICVIYYLANGETYISKGNANKTSIEYFFENENGSQIPVSQSNIVPIDKLYEVAKYFFEFQTKATTVEWIEL